MFLLADNRPAFLEVEILYIFLMILGYLLVFLVQTYLFMIMWLVRTKRVLVWRPKMYFLDNMGSCFSCSFEEHCV